MHICHTRCMKIISIILGCFALLGLLLGFLPFFGWLNWFFVLPPATIGLILGVAIADRAATVISGLALAFGMLRLFLGGGII